MKATAFLMAMCLCQLTISSQEVIWPDLTDRTLLEKVVEIYKPVEVLSYGKARDVMFQEIYMEDDSVSCVYTGHTLYLPSGVDPSSHLYMNASSDGINTEHVYPRSKGASEENGNAFSDLHNLFPSRYAVNIARSNFPFGEINDEETTSWFIQNETGSVIPDKDIERHSERVNGMFEPREDHKGNIARAMFYFITMYEEHALLADAGFFESQRETICWWDHIDPVDADEELRTWKIAEYQDNQPNPFVVDCSLSGRTYCSEFDFSCGGLTTSTNDIGVESILVYPIPVEDVLNIESYGHSLVQIFNIQGKRLMQEEFQGQLSVDVSSYSSGTYVVIVNGETIKIVK